MCLSTRPNILLVTECNLFQKVVEKLLAKDYYLTIAKNYQQAAVDYSQQKIDLGVFDISDSEEDGLAVCQIWREIPEFQDLPLILLTSRASKIGKEQEDIAYLKQPVELRQLHKMIKKLIKLKHHTDCSNPRVFVENAKQFINDSEFFRLNYI